MWDGDMGRGIWARGCMWAEGHRQWDIDRGMYVGRECRQGDTGKGMLVGWG